MKKTSISIISTGLGLAFFSLTSCTMNVPTVDPVTTTQTTTSSDLNPYTGTTTTTTKKTTAY